MRKKERTFKSSRRLPSKESVQRVAIPLLPVSNHQERADEDQVVARYRFGLPGIVHNAQLYIDKIGGSRTPGQRPHIRVTLTAVKEDETIQRNLMLFEGENSIVSSYPVGAGDRFILSQTEGPEARGFWLTFDFESRLIVRKDGVEE